MTSEQWRAGEILAKDDGQRVNINGRNTVNVNGGKSIIIRQRTTMECVLELRHETDSQWRQENTCSRDIGTGISPQPRRTYEDACARDDIDRKRGVAEPRSVCSRLYSDPITAPLHARPCSAAQHRLVLDPRVSPIIGGRSPATSSVSPRLRPVAIHHSLCRGVGGGESNTAVFTLL